MFGRSASRRVARLEADVRSLERRIRDSRYDTIRHLQNAAHLERQISDLEACVIPGAAFRFLAGELRWIGDATEAEMVAQVREIVATRRGFELIRKQKDVPPC